MSDLGAMVLFNDTQSNKKGLRCFFFDMIYENTTSQGAKELFAGLDCLKEQLISDKFKKKTNNKIFSKILLYTDNALNDIVHTAFILQRNSQNPTLQIKMWLNPEAQASIVLLLFCFSF